MIKRKPRIHVHDAAQPDLRSEEERALDQLFGTQGHRARLQVTAGTVRRVDHIRAFDVRGRDLSQHILTQYRQQRIRYDHVGVTMSSPDLPSYVILHNNLHGARVIYMLSKDDFTEIKGHYETQDIRVGSGHVVDTRTVRTHYDISLDLTIPFWANEFSRYTEHGYTGDPPHLHHI